MMRFLLLLLYYVYLQLLFELQIITVRLSIRLIFFLGKNLDTNVQKNVYHLYNF